MFDAPQQGAHGGGKARFPQLRGQAGHIFRVGNPHRPAQMLFGQFPQAGQFRPGAGKDDAAIGQSVQPGLLAEAADRHFQNFQHPGIQRLAQRPAESYPFLLPGAAGQQHFLVRRHQFRQSAAPLDFDFLGHIVGNALGYRQIPGQLAAAHRQHRGADRIAIAEQGYIGAAAANIHQNYPHFPLVGGQNGLGGGQGLGHHSVDRNAVGRGGGNGIFQDGRFSGNNMGFQLHLAGVQAGGIANPGKAVHLVAHRDDVQGFPVFLQPGQGRLDEPMHFLGRDAAGRALGLPDAPGVDAGQMGAADHQISPGVGDTADIAAGFVMGGLDRRLDFLNVLDATLLNALGGGDAGAEDFQLPFGADPGHDGADFAGAQVQGSVKSLFHQISPVLTANFCRFPRRCRPILIPLVLQQVQDERNGLPGVNPPAVPPPLTGRCGCGDFPQLPPPRAGLPAG